MAPGSAKTSVLTRGEHAAMTTAFTPSFAMSSRITWTSSRQKAGDVFTTETCCSCATRASVSLSTHSPIPQPLQT